MRKVLLILLLLCTKTLLAQNFYLGANTGLAIYSYRQSANNSYPDFPIGLCAQYVNKNNCLGGELNFILQPFSPLIADDNVATPAVATVGYLFYNLNYHEKSPMVQLKAGFFYSYYIGGDYSPPLYDYGPAVGVNFAFKVSKMAYFGFDISYMYGLRYTLVADAEQPNNWNYSNITYKNFLLKFVHKI